MIKTVGTTIWMGRDDMKDAIIRYLLDHKDILINKEDIVIDEGGCTLTISVSSEKI